MENHAVDRFRSGLRDMFDPQTQKRGRGRGWKVKRESVHSVGQLERHRKRRITRTRGGWREGKREVLASSSGFRACRYSGRFSSTLMKPITLRLAKGTPLIAGSRRFWGLFGVPRPVLQHVYGIRYRHCESWPTPFPRLRHPVQASCNDDDPG